MLSNLKERISIELLRAKKKTKPLNKTLENEKKKKKITSHFSLIRLVNDPVPQTQNDFDL